MARTDRTTLYKSTHFPGELEYILPRGSPVPQLSRMQERALIRLGSFGWRLYRARIRKDLADKLGDRLRSVILKRLPESIYGIKVYSKRSVQIRALVPHHEEPNNAMEFITYLGPHAAEVITGIHLPLQQLLSDPANYDRFVRAILDEFGEEIAGEVGVTFRKEAMWKLIRAGELEEPPENMFRLAEGDSRRLLIDRIDNLGNVIK